MNRILVTGAGGLIGRHSLTALMALGFEVHATCLRTPAAGPAAVAWHSVDLLDPAATRALVAQVRATHLLHLAWHTHPADFWTSPQNDRWRQASIEFAGHFLQHGGRRIVAAGTCAEYDLRDGTCSEAATAIAPTTVYGRAKRATCEQLLALGAQSQAAVAWARLFGIYGPGEQPGRLVPDTLLSLLAGDQARCTHGAQVRDYLVSIDAAEALVRLLASDVTGCVNIASGRSVTVRDIVLAAADAVGLRDRVRFGALAAPAGEPQRIVADVGRLSREVSWRPRIGLAEGMALTAAYWRSRTPRHA